MISKLIWDSDFFKKNIANINVNIGNINFKIIEDFVVKNDINLVQALVSSSNLDLINDFENNSFRMEESVVTFVKKLQKRNIKNNKKIRVAKLDDLDYIKTYINGIFKESRYKRIVKKELVDKFYYTWLKKSILGEFDDICFVYEVKGNPVGFITIKNNSNSNSNIGIIAISSEYRGNKIGKKLIEYSEDYLANNGVDTFFVKTQGNNILAQNFYIKNSFLIKDLMFWFYKVY